MRAAEAVGSSLQSVGTGIGFIIDQTSPFSLRHLPSTFCTIRMGWNLKSFFFPRKEREVALYIQRPPKNLPIDKLFSN